MFHLVDNSRADTCNKYILQEHNDNFFQTNSGNSHYAIVRIKDKNFNKFLNFFYFLSDLNEIKLILFVKKF